MKNAIFICLISAAVFSSCKKDAEIADPSYRNGVPAEGVLPEVEGPSTTIFITNVSHHDDAFIEHVYTGANTEIGGTFPIGRNSQTTIVSTSLGTFPLYVEVRKTGVNKSIGVTDSKGTLHCKNISGSGYETLLFEGIVMEENKPLTVSYHLTTCINLPEPVLD